MSASKAKKKVKAWSQVTKRVRDFVSSELRREIREARLEASWFSNRGRWAPEELPACRDAVAFWKQYGAECAEGLAALRAIAGRKGHAR